MELFLTYHQKVYSLWITNIWDMLGKLRIVSFYPSFKFTKCTVCHLTVGAPASFCISCFRMSSAVRCHTLHPVFTDIRHLCDFFSSGSHPFDYEPAATYASSDWLSHIRESRSLAKSEFSNSYIHIETILKGRIIECKPVFHSYLWDDLSDGP